MVEVFGQFYTVVMFASHHWPTWDSDPIRELLTQQRDMYAYKNDQTLRMLNNGRTGREIAENFEPPSTLSPQWWNRGYYGSISHNVKAIYHRYMGWFDGNPAQLWQQPPMQEGKFYIECFGGVDKLVEKAIAYQEKGELRFAATLLSHAVFRTNPSNENAKTALSNVLEKLGYGAENGTWRNFFLTGAYELRNGIQAPVFKNSIDSLMALDIN